MEEHHEQQGGDRDNKDDKPEQTPHAAPEIWAGSLSDYNAGRLHGEWIDATGDLTDLEEAVTEMLAASTTPGAEEWAIFDTNGFGPLRMDEHEQLATVNRAANGIAEHGPAFAHYAALMGTTDAEQLERFEDAYLGHFDSFESWAENFMDDLGYIDAIEAAVPEGLVAYVKLDVEALARDMEFSGTYGTSPDGAGVYVFDMGI